jgi:hypothetical protein
MTETGQGHVDRVRGRPVRCGCGAALGVFRRRRFYPLVVVEDDKAQEGLLRCPSCGAEHRLRLLVQQWERWR